MSMAWVRNTYNVPAKRGRLVRFKDRIGRITSATSHIKVRFGDRRMTGYYHPREKGLVYLSDDGTDLQVACLCTKCGEREVRYYDRCAECCSPSWGKLVGLD